jgi:hypothetical protein
MKLTDSGIVFSRPKPWTLRPFHEDGLVAAKRSGITLALAAALVTAGLVGINGCTEVLDSNRISDCVEVYANTGAVRRPGFTKSACEQHCAMVQGALDCYWDEDAAKSAYVAPRRSSLLAFPDEPHDFPGLSMPPEA